ncbi:MAG: hypothetical protein BGN89_20435 [Alphaproteobacteria bacterium 64-6]|nr:MAG: hypothetical protein BGN89_20435 [Alphaproteobacteria bacterium 64-6]
MSTNDMIMPLARTDELPVVRTISFHDLRQSLMHGLDDFLAMKTHVVFLSLIYPIVGVILWFATAGLDLLALLYPLATGFALLGPFAAIGLYELSRRREMHLDTSWRHTFDVLHSPSLGPILLLGLLLFVVFLIWIAVAHGIYVANFGVHDPEPLSIFMHKVLTTEPGHHLIVVGNLVGAAFAVFVFVISVISFPLLLERNVGEAVAVTTSLKAVAANPLVMTFWAAIIAGGLLIGSLPLLVGLAVVMPVLGHASWHLYRCVVEPRVA